MALDYRELKRAIKNMEDGPAKYMNFLDKFMLEMGERAKGYAVKGTPANNGDLRDIGWELSSVYHDGDSVCIDLINTMEYASWVEDGHKQIERWVPGVWVGNEFNYDPKSKEGMKLKAKFIPGHHMARSAIKKIEIEIPIRYEQQIKLFLDGYLDGGG